MKRKEMPKDKKNGSSVKQKAWKCRKGLVLIF